MYKNKIPENFKFFCNLKYTSSCYIKILNRDRLNYFFAVVFFFVGFRILKLHVRFSSTIISAAELSNSLE